MELQALLQENNSLMKRMLEEFATLKSKISSQDVDTCSPKEAMRILGISNPRLLTYFWRLNLIDRRKGTTDEEKSHFLYYRDQLEELAQKIRSKKIVIPTMAELYGKDND